MSLVSIDSNLSGIPKGAKGLEPKFSAYVFSSGYVDGGGGRRDGRGGGSRSRVMTESNQQSGRDAQSGLTQVETGPTLVHHPLCNARLRPRGGSLQERPPIAIAPARLHAVGGTVVPAAGVRRGTGLNNDE